MVDDRAQLIFEKFSMPSFMFCEPAALGDYCRTIFRAGKPFIIIGENGVSPACGNE
jgi:hypothetical protein